MNADPVTLIEELVYGMCSADVTLQGLIPDGSGSIRLYPHPAPESVEAPFVTHDIAGDERSAMPIGGAPGMFTVLWWIAAWSDGVNRQELRPIVLALQQVLVGPEMKGKTLAFTSDDDSAWQVGIRRVGAMPAPAGVDDSGRYHRVMVAYQFEINGAG